MAKTPYRAKMWAVMKNGQTHMILPDIDTAETYFGMLSKNGFSKHTWEMKPVEVRFAHETAAERRARLERSVQAVCELNRQMSRVNT